MRLAAVLGRHPLTRGWVLVVLGVALFYNITGMAKPTTIKEAISRWEERTEVVAAEATDIQLQLQWPPIEKMDATLSTLSACQKLSLSSNMIEKIAGIAGMRNLRILSLGRNNIRSISGIETVAETLEELWISYNLIDKLKGIGALRKLSVLYMCNNLVKEWVEFNRLQECGALRDLVFIGNPVMENQPDVEAWRTQASNRLPQITKLDGVPVIRETEE